MWTAWGVLSILQLASNRYLKTNWKINMWIHRITGTIILLITFVLGFLALAKKNWTIDKDLHNVSGFIILVVVLILVLGGVFSRSMMNRIRWNTPLLLKIKFGHRVIIFAINTFIAIRCCFHSIFSGGYYFWWIKVSFIVRQRRKC
jgi:hypothetical protein